ncbi:AmiS/UreI family transporter [Arthrobacter sp. Bz4]|uniref:AmiS/UreI family transporter n=1 Tax=Arthrobacter sp. Bz4 TaxID=2171979 RepID=UPI000D5192F7|nr:AmiS/UreI family transporter [Arthrobacter sp. Bz4]PVE14963.1 AmiS/UreI transporter [Arthrobacter sp. Bz4]
MSYICLILSGAALLINGLGLLGRIPARDSGVFNIVIGILQLLLAVLLATAAGGNTELLLGAAGIVLFGLTYLYVGLNAVLNLESAGVGWFCALVALLAVFYSVANIARDPFLSVLWLSWAALWSLFFLVLAGGKSSLSAFTGWAAILAGQITTTAPALLGLSGAWPAGSVLAGITAVVVAGLFTVALVISKSGGSRNPAATEPAALAEPVSA